MSMWQALSAFMMYVRDRREAVGEEIGTRAVADLSKALGEQWQNEVDKSRWEALASQDAERWQRDMALYEQTLRAEEAADDARIPQAEPKRVAAPPDPQQIRERLWRRAGLEGPPRKFTSEDRKAWMPLAQEKFREQKRMRDEGSANIQTLVWLAAHVGMPEPPAKAHRSGYAMYSQHRLSEMGFAMNNTKELKKIGAEWKALPLEAQRPWLHRHDAAVAAHEQACDEHDRALANWRSNRAPPVEGVPECGCSFCVPAADRQE